MPTSRYRNGTLRTCKFCGKIGVRCKQTKPNGTRCKNRPRLCGFCALHCEGHKERSAKKRKKTLQENAGKMNEKRNEKKNDIKPWIKAKLLNDAGMGVGVPPEKGGWRKLFGW